MKIVLIQIVCAVALVIAVSWAAKQAQSAVESVMAAAEGRVTR